MRQYAEWIFLIIIAAWVLTHPKGFDTAITASSKAFSTSVGALMPPTS